MNPCPFHSLESIPGLVALETTWQRMVGPQFAAFSALCLEPSSVPVKWIPCPRHCGCNHFVLRRHDGTGAVAACRCNPPACPDIQLTLRDITPLQVNRVRLGHALCQAFGFAGRHAELFNPVTFQFGSWSADCVPAILTIQVQSVSFHSAVARLAALLRQPFILFAPTSDFLDAHAKALLESCHAGFFALDTQVILTEHGTVQPTSAPGELFARFTPQPKDIDIDVARRVFALVEALHTEKPLPHPDLMDVFRHYCMQELSAGQIARDYKCSKPTVLRRLALIRARTGIDPQQLRRLSPHIAKLQDTLSDSRAARLRPQAALEQDDDDYQ